MDRPPPDYPPILDYENPVERIVHERAELLLYRSTRRIDQYRVTVNDKVWKKAIGRSGVMAGIRKSMWRQFTSNQK